FEVDVDAQVARDGGKSLQEALGCCELLVPRHVSAESVVPETSEKCRLGARGGRPELTAVNRGASFHHPPEAEDDIAFADGPQLRHLGIRVRIDFTQTTLDVHAERVGVLADLA